MQTALTVGVRDLRDRAEEVIREVRTKGTTIQIKYRGKIVAQIVPVREPVSTATSSEAWTSLDQLATEIGASWPKYVSAVDTVRDVRRDL